jgi:hypothetical protein
MHQSPTPDITRTQAGTQVADTQVVEGQRADVKSYPEGG